MFNIRSSDEVLFFYEQTVQEFSEEKKEINNRRKMPKLSNAQIWADNQMIDRYLVSIFAIAAALNLTNKEQREIFKKYGLKWRGYHKDYGWKWKEVPLLKIVK